MSKPKFETPNLTAENVAKIAKLFPGVVTEGKVNIDLLRSMLGEEVFGDEAYEFTWVGKRAAIAEAGRPIRKTLRPVVEDESTPTGADSTGKPYCSSGSRDWNTTENLYIEGDNLDVLKLLQESYLGKVKMVYIDPPYNTGNDFVYRDRFTASRDEYEDESGVIDEETDYRLFKNTETNGRFHSDWCSMMYPRLVLARSLLTNDGVIFISIDDNEVAQLRKICDEIYGEDNLVNCFVWNCSTAGGIRPKFASKTHEYILCYAKSKENLPMLFAPLSEDAKKMYTQRDEKGLYRDKDFVFKNKSTNVNQKYLIECPDGELVKPKDGYIYRFIRNRFDEAISDGMVTFKKTTTGPLLTESGEQAHWNIYIKKYLGDAMGAPSTLIPKEMMSIYNVGTQCVQNLFDDTRVFENVKPVDVISYFANMASVSDSIILDFFSGSATTAHAVMQLNAEDGGNRKFIMVQLPEVTDEKSEAYKAGYKNICEIGKERIRRAGDKIKAEMNAANAQLKIGEDSKQVPDIGFRVLKLDDTNMNDVYYAAGDYTQDMIALMESNIKPDRTDLDLLYGCLLDWGLPLSMPHTHEKIDGFTIHTYNDGDLIACFEERISEKAIREIASRKPLRAVFRDSSFNSSPEKINVFEIFKLLAPNTNVRVI